MADAAPYTAHGKFIWYDVMTTDVKAAEAFYAAVIGWSMKDSGMADYTLLLVGDTMVGGIMAIPADSASSGVQPAWMGYIGVSDVDDLASCLKNAGGTIHRGPADIPNVGRFAVAGDPHGAGFMIFRPNANESPTPLAEGTPGTFGWRDLRAGNGAEAFAFYSNLFGWTKSTTIEMGPHAVYQMFDAGGQRGGIMTKRPDTPVPHWQYFIHVDAIDAASARVLKAGGKITMPAAEVPGGQWIAECTDPQGASFGIVAAAR